MILVFRRAKNAPVFISNDKLEPFMSSVSLQGMYNYELNMFHVEYYFNNIDI